MSIVNFLYNPDRKGKGQLIAEFVVRQNVLKEIMDDLEGSSMKRPEQHYLIVGQRGTGKTTLLNRVKYAVEDSNGLNKWLIPIIFSEEQYNISELANLWENIAQVLEDYYGFDGLYAEMEKHAEKGNFEEICWDILEEGLDKSGKKIVLLIDNIGDLFKKIKELEVRRFREILQTKHQLRIIAASPLYLESILDYKQPMFEFFKVIRLESLNSRETLELLLKLAEIHHEETKIEQIIKETPERIEVLRVLTGGVPRTIALMFNIFIENEHESSLKDLENILDAVTPLYKHRMDDLPPQQQKIIDAVAKNWDPIGVKQLKERVRLESKVISAQLRQLEKNQVVQKMETGNKNHEYILKERFFNIWYLMRYGRKDDRQRVIWLVRFLESWCTNEELEKRVADFIELVKRKKDRIENMEVFALAYTSMAKLKTEFKLLLDENLPDYRVNIQYNNAEIDVISQRKFKEGDFRECIRWMSLRREMTNKDRNLVLDMAGEDLKNNTEGYFILVQDMFNEAINQEDVDSSIFQIYFYSNLLYAQMNIIARIERDSLEAALEITKQELELIGMFMAIFEDINLYQDFNMELKTLLVGIKLLYKKGQYNSLSKMFFQGEIELKSKKVKFSEIFNPIYLALNSLNPEEKAINIAPEKEGIVRQIREFITAK